MKTKQYIFSILFIGLALWGCKKDPVKPGKNADVYVSGTITAGNGITVAAYWQNGIAIRLADSLAPSSANAIAVSGSDVYVAGMATVDGKVTAVYWKNGVMTKLTNGNSGWASANAIVIDGKDVYIAGNAVNGDDITVVGFTNLGATYWKNGAPVKLPDSAAFGGHSSYATGIAISGGDIYISGNVSGIITSGPVYWKNGTLITLSDGTYKENASCITVNGPDVFVGGTTNNNSNVAYWKNNSPTLIPNAGYVTGASSILVNANDIYLTGTSPAPGNNNSVATYWKNGAPVQLTDGLQLTGYSTATSMAINNPDIYVAGTLGPDAAYWVNGKLMHLSKNARTSGIVVVP